MITVGVSFERHNSLNNVTRLTWPQNVPFFYMIAFPTWPIVYNVTVYLPSDTLL